MKVKIGGRIYNKKMTTYYLHTGGGTWSSPTVRYKGKVYLVNPTAMGSDIFKLAREIKKGSGWTTVWPYGPGGKRRKK